MSCKVISDPQLPHLAAAIDAGAMAQRLGCHLKTAYPSLAWQVGECTIEKVYYHQKRNCGILYRLGLEHPSGDRAEEWFFGQMFPSSKAYKRFEREVSSVKRFHPAHDFLRGIQPVRFLPDLSMILRVFPRDPQLGSLPNLVDRRFIQKQVEANLGAFELNGRLNGGDRNGWRCRDVTYERIKYMPGKRCVLRFHVDLVQSQGVSRELNFYSKSYDDARSRYHFGFLRTTYDQLIAQHSTLQMPRPVLYLKGANTIWQEEWPGQPLIHVIQDLNAEEIFPRIAGVLADLHQTKISGLRPAPALDDTLGRADRARVGVSQMFPALRQALNEVTTELTVEKASIEKQRGQSVPIHGDIEIEQIRLRDGQLALMDFDTIAIGDPLFDVAEFIASLLYQELKYDRPRDQLMKAAGLFYRAYQERVPWNCDKEHLEWYTTAFLLSKMFLSVKNLEECALRRIENDSAEILQAFRGVFN